MGSYYYHSDCAENKRLFQMIISAFHEKINPTSPVSQIRQVVNNLVFQQNKCSLDFVLFTIDYAANHKMSLNHPPGLTYFVQNKEIQDAYYRFCHKPHRLEEFKLGAAPIAAIDAVEKKEPKGKRLSFSEIVSRKKRKREV